MKKIALLFLCILLSGCTLSGISVHTDYLSRQNLASYYVNTPDPKLNNPPIGQRLIVTWALPRLYLNYEDLLLEILIRFRTREQIVVNIPLYKTRGTYIYSLLDEEYFQKEGILTYKVTLYGNECILEEWKHQVWAELITFSDEPKEPALPQIDDLLSPQSEEDEKDQEADPNFEFEETTLPQEFRLSRS